MRGFLSGVLLVALVFVVFGRVLTHDFVMWDDDANIYENGYVLRQDRTSLARFWRKPYMSLYIPLTYTAWWLLALPAARVASIRWSARVLNPAFFHGANIVLHAIAAVFVFRILQALLASSERLRGSRAGPGTARAAGAAFWGAALFALHPLQVEAVAWATGLKDVLAGVLGLGALDQMLRAAGPAPASKNTARAWPHIVFGTLLFVLAIMAKPSTVAVPFMAGALLWGLRTEPAGAKRWGRGPLFVLLGWGLLTVPWIVLTRRMQPPALLEHACPVWCRPLVAADAVTFYLYKLLAPFRLGPDYGRQPAAVLGSWRAWLLLTVPVGFAAMFWCKRRAWPLATTAAMLFVAGLLPVLGLVPFRFQHYSTVADRYVYLGLLGPALLTSAVVARNPARLCRVAAAFLLAGLCVLSRRQARVWRDSLTLFEHGIALNPESYELHTNLGNFVAGKGDLDGALAHYRLALQINPANPDPHINIGNVYRTQGNHEQAVSQYFEALAKRPEYPEAHYNLGVAYDALGKQGAAVIHYSQALAIRPDYAQAHNNLGLLLAARNERERARHHYLQALALNPYYTDARNNLALLLAGEGDAAGALRQYSAALRVDPGNLEVHNNLGVLLAGQGRTEEGIFHYSQVIALNPRMPAAHINLANALGRIGRNREAIAHYRAALVIHPYSLEAHYNLGLILAKTGKLATAASHFSQALRVRPDFEPALKGLRTLREMADAANANRKTGPREGEDTHSEASSARESRE